MPFPDGAQQITGLFGIPDDRYAGMMVSQALINLAQRFVGRDEDNGISRDDAQLL